MAAIRTTSAIPAGRISQGIQRRGATVARTSGIVSPQIASVISGQARPMMLYEKTIPAQSTAWGASAHARSRSPDGNGRSPGSETAKASTSSTSAVSLKALWAK